MTTDTTERGLEALITTYLRDVNRYEEGHNSVYARLYALDTTRLFRFLAATQAAKLEQMHILAEPIEKKRFLQYLDRRLSKDGVIKLLRKGLDYKYEHFDLFYVRPSAGNARAAELFAANIFSVTRQVHYSEQNKKLAPDLVIFLNGLPIITFELKNQLTKQSTADAVHQYKVDRSPKEKLFAFRRCIVHFAVDDSTVEMCTHLAGKDSWFLPFNKGYQDGAGNPPNPHGLKTAYLWEDILQKVELAKIIENYVQVTERKDTYTGKASYKQIFPRYHQLRLVESLLADAQRDGVGQRYLIQHSAGSGKSNEIAWLAHQLVTLRDAAGREVFDTVIVVTDRINLDRQIRDTIRQFMQVTSTVGWAKDSAELRTLLQRKCKIIITVVHKFQFILQDIDAHHAQATFAVLIDEAHSSQNGSLSAKMNMVLSDEERPDDFEDTVNALVEERIKKRKLLHNASYFAFTATPKNKTLEMFGRRIDRPDGEVEYRPHYIYTMKQAIEEHFILDVLKYYTPVQSYYRLIKTAEDDPRFDKKKSEKLLRAFVEAQPRTIERKAEIIVEHFHTEVISRGKIGGQARAMVVTKSIAQAIEYYEAISRLLVERRSPYRALIAFSGEKEHGGQMMTEASFNGFPSSEIERRFKENPYRLLVVANKFQTGFDEPLLHTMYVDKPLADIMAVQTLSRLNRCHPLKKDTFVLDFANRPEVIQAAFSRYYKTTMMSGETDPNKLNELIEAMEPHEVYTLEQVDQFADQYLHDVPRQALDPLLDRSVERYLALPVEDQIEFKSCAKNFVRTYNFLAAIMPYGKVDWEKLSIFLKLLLLKLPAPQGEDLTDGLLEAVDLESYRAEAQEQMSLALADEDGEVKPVPISGQIGIPVPDVELLSDILHDFHEVWGGGKLFPPEHEEHVAEQIASLPQAVRKVAEYQNAMQHSDAQNARVESDQATQKAVLETMSTGIELYRAFTGNESFKNWLLREVFEQTYEPRSRG